MFDPIQAESSTTPPILLDLQPIPNDSVALRWSSIPGRLYRVAYCDSLDTDTWILLPDTFRASTTTLAAEHLLPPSAGHRFYRGILLP